MHIRLLESSDAEIYRDILLMSLKDSPEAFLTTYELEKEKSIEMIRNNLMPSDSQFTLGAFNKNNRLVGIVRFIREDNLKTNHKGSVIGMFVLPEWRGQGIGKALMKQLIKKAKKCDGLERINLTVISNNDTAKNLYRSIGYEVYGSECNAIKTDGQYWDADFMVLII
ncbi:GNAT family N-acetyltransferase [Paenibacillus sp. sptzw28]|nr:GNAT family N-acetyltransferase [Paenibacillus sp. sptzw28]